MYRYLVAATLLKLFSANRLTRQVYRSIGNSKRSQQRYIAQDILAHYISNGNHFVELIQEYNMIQPHDQLIEIGTGWTHALSLLVRLNFNISITMFDVADIRNFGGCLTYLTALSNRLGHDRMEGLSSTTLAQALNSRNLEELYRLLSLNYIIQSEGSLAGFLDNTFQCVFSGDVLEHIPAHKAQQSVDEIYRILKPGGYSVHIIGLDDHLAHYDKSVSPKNYYRYSETVWKLIFQNKLQYFNRIQASEWLRYFTKSGFSCVENKTTWRQDVGNLPINSKFSSYSADDLSCCRLLIVHRKPDQKGSNRRLV